MLVGLPHNRGPAMDRKLIAERNLKVAQGHPTARAVNYRGYGPSNLREAITCLVREERNDFRRSLQSEPLKTVTNSFPDQAHRAIVNMVRVRRESVHTQHAVIPSRADGEGPPNCKLRSPNPNRAQPNVSGSPSAQA